jgi:hypothetical protein
MQWEPSILRSCGANKVWVCPFISSLIFISPYLYSSLFSFQDLRFVKEVDPGLIEFWMQWEPRILSTCGANKVWVYPFISTLIFISSYLNSSLCEFFIWGPEVCQGGRCRADRILDERTEADSCQLWRNKNESLHFHVDSHFYSSTLFTPLCTSFVYQNLSFILVVDVRGNVWWMKGQKLILVSCGGIKMRVYIFMLILIFIPPHPYFPNNLKSRCSSSR